VLSVEQIYVQWSDVATGIDGSYRIFKTIVNIYEKMFIIDIACRHREIAYTIRDRIILWEGLFVDVDPLELVESFFLFWYGIFWSQPEDIGFAIGVYIRQIFSIKIEDNVASEDGWICPDKNSFDSRETYGDWVIGKW